MNVGLVTLATKKYHELLRLSEPLFIAYANRHKFSYIPIEDSLDDGRPEAWSKLLGIRNALVSYEIVVYIDSDALLLNQAANIVNDLPLNADFAWRVAPFEGIPTPNAGVMVFRNTKATFDLLAQAYSCDELIHDGWWEQIALMKVLGYPDPRVLREGQPLKYPKRISNARVYHLSTKWNVTSEDIGDSEVYIRHFAGDPFNLKKLLMIDYLSHAFTKQELIALDYNVKHLHHEYGRLRTKFYESEANVHKLISVRLKKWVKGKLRQRHEIPGQI